MFCFEYLSWQKAKKTKNVKESSVLTVSDSHRTRPQEQSFNQTFANSRSAGDVLHDIGSMLSDLTDELDAMLKLEKDDWTLALALWDYGRKSTSARWRRKYCNLSLSLFPGSQSQPLLFMSLLRSNRLETLIWWQCRGAQEIKWLGSRARKSRIGIIEWWCKFMPPPHNAGESTKWPEQSSRWDRDQVTRTVSRWDREENEEWLWTFYHGEKIKCSFFSRPTQTDISTFCFSKLQNSHISSKISLSPILYF